MTSNLILYGVLSSILAVVIISMVNRLSHYLRFRGMNSSNYTGFDLNGNKHEDRKYSVKFSFWRKKVVIKQISEKHGNWISNIFLSNANPYIASGNYKYLTIHDGTWGTHEIVINREDEILNITARSKSIPGEDKYLLKKGVN